MILCTDIRIILGRTKDRTLTLILLTELSMRIIMAIMVKTGGLLNNMQLQVGDQKHVFNQHWPKYGSIYHNIIIAWSVHTCQYYHNDYSNIPKVTNLNNFHD